MQTTRPERGYAAALAAVFIWALVPVGTRFFVLRVDPYMFNVLRFLAAGGAAIPLCLTAKPWRWRRADQGMLLTCAALAVAGYNIPVALGARTVSAGTTWRSTSKPKASRSRAVCSACGAQSPAGLSDGTWRSESVV